MKTKTQQHTPKKLSDGSEVCIIDDCTCRGKGIAVGYTPGPWEVSICLNDEAVDGWPLLPGEFTPGPVTYRINDQDGKMNTSEADANARLIAASPELLEAAKMALRNIEFCQRRLGGWELEVKTLRAAILKAEAKP